MVWIVACSKRTADEQTGCEQTENLETAEDSDNQV